ncbi:MAG: hypothetical protein V4576_01755 [Patescibacteria group bacterium]
MAVKSLSRKQRRRRKVLMYIGIFFAVVAVLYLIYGPLLKIKTVEIHGARHTTIADVQNDAFADIDGYRYLVVPNDHIFFYTKGKMKDQILKTYPSVETIDMHLDIHRVLHIDIKDRKPLGVWCSTECYFYDTAGVIFKKSFVYTGALFTAWSKSPDVAVNFLDTITCEGLCTDQRFIDFLRKHSIEKVTMFDEMMEMQSSAGYVIKAGFEASTTLSHIEEIDQNKPGFLETLEYVDVRFPNKVYYKERL